jgi:hypothetical protein
VVFPHMIVPLFVGREKSIRALEDVMGQAGTLKSLVEMASDRGDNVRALSLLSVATELFAGIRYVSGLLDSLDVYARLLARVGEPEGAARLWGARHTLDEEIGRERGPIAPPVSKSRWQSAHSF